MDLNKIREDAEKHYEKEFSNEYNIIKDLRDKPLITFDAMIKFAAMYHAVTTINSKKDK